MVLDLLSSQVSLVAQVDLDFPSLLSYLHFQGGHEDLLYQVDLVSQEGLEAQGFLWDLPEMGQENQGDLGDLAYQGIPESLVHPLNLEGQDFLEGQGLLHHPFDQKVLGVQEVLGFQSLVDLVLPFVLLVQECHLDLACLFHQGVLVVQDALHHLQDQVLLEGQGYQEDHSYPLVQEALVFLGIRAGRVDLLLQGFLVSQADQPHP